MNKKKKLLSEEEKEKIRKRDNYTCQGCTRKLNEYDWSKFSIHHIDENKVNNNPKNLITFCHLCHRRTHFGIELEKYDKTKDKWYGTESHILEQIRKKKMMSTYAFCEWLGIHRSTYNKIINNNIGDSIRVSVFTNIRIKTGLDIRDIAPSNPICKLINK